MPDEGLDDLEPVIGLEVHAQLLTRTKLFCSCPNRFGGPPNSHVCPWCLGHPGVLPVLNGKAVVLAARAALALGMELNTRSSFDRKHYFYPDLPKGYQLTQHSEPLARGGCLALDGDEGTRNVGIERLHLEEDAGKLSHDRATGWTLVDFNRCGVPLVEIVSCPELRSPAEAAAYLGELRELLVALGVTDGSMEEGSLRCDANVSLRRRGSGALGTRTELKNINSFRFMARGLACEIERQRLELRAGRSVEQETRSYDPAADRTAPLRSKEEARDYRYLPEPDLPLLVLTEELLEEARSWPAELPRERRRRLMERWGLSVEEARTLGGTAELADWFERGAATSKEPRKVVNWIVRDVVAWLKETGRSLDSLPVRPEDLAALVDGLAARSVSSAQGRELFREMVATGQPPSAIIERRGMALVTDRAVLEPLARRIVKAHPREARRYRDGRHGLLEFLMARVMEETRGQAEPKLLRSILQEVLAETP